MEFRLHSEYQPTGDQPQAIKELVDGFKQGNQFQTLLGVTGSGKTFTMANVIQALNKPTLIIAHNKTLAGQLYGEFKEFFPENAVEYFVSYYAMAWYSVLRSPKKSRFSSIFWNEWYELDGMKQVEMVEIVNGIRRERFMEIFMYLWKKLI